MAFGIAASMASGIIEYLTDGAWTKRLHPGWAAQSGYRAALLARTGFFAPRTVFEGAHSFFRAFAPTATPDYSHLTVGLGRRSEEHTSELQSLMRLSYAVFCLKKKNQ